MASINDEFSLKRLSAKNGKNILYPENLNYELIEITLESEFQVFCVAIYDIYRLI